MSRRVVMCRMRRGNIHERMNNSTGIAFRRRPLLSVLLALSALRSEDVLILLVWRRTMRAGDGDGGGIPRPREEVTDDEERESTERCERCRSRPPSVGLDVAEREPLKLDREPEGDFGDARCGGIM